jgi:hypothetical protein
LEAFLFRVPLSRIQLSVAAHGNRGDMPAHHSSFVLNYLSKPFVKYQNGSRPDGKTPQTEVDEIKKLLSEMVEKTKSDFKSGVFKEFHPYQTKTGFHF